MVDHAIIVIMVTWMISQWVPFTNGRPQKKTVVTLWELMVFRKPWSFLPAKHGKKLLGKFMVNLSPTFISCECDTGDIAGGCVRFVSAHESTKIHQQPMGKLMLWGPVGLGFLDEIPFLRANHAPNKNGCISNRIVAFQILLAIFH